MHKKVKCHCGAVEIQVDVTESEFTKVTRCDCSFCSRRGAATISMPLAQLQITKGADNLSLYTWGTNTAQHYFCKTCGIYTHHQCRSNPNEYGVNIGCIEGINVRDYANSKYSDGINHPSDA